MGLMHTLRVLILGFCLFGAQAAMAVPQVVVTIKPLYGITASVMEGVGTPDLLMDGTMSPHNFQFRPSQMSQLSNADVVIWMGRDIEMPLADSIRELPSDVRVLEMTGATGLIHLPYRTGGVWQAVEHDEDAHEDHEHEGAMDPHLWLDPRNGILMAHLIAEALADADPDHAAQYMANASAYGARLSALDAALQDQLDPFAEQPFIVFHDAFQYFETHYGLRGVGAIALDPERAPGPRTVMALHDAATALGVVCVFAEPQFNGRMAANVAAGSSARTATLDPLGASLPATADVYELLLTGLADDFAACMRGSPD